VLKHPVTGETMLTLLAGLTANLFRFVIFETV